MLLLQVGSRLSEEQPALQVAVVAAAGKSREGLVGCRSWPEDFSTNPSAARLAEQAILHRWRSEVTEEHCLK